MCTADGTDGEIPGAGVPGAGVPGAGVGPDAGVPGARAGCCAAAGAGFVSVAQALRAGRAFAAYLNSPAARDLDGPARARKRRLDAM